MEILIIIIHINYKVLLLELKHAVIFTQISSTFCCFYRTKKKPPCSFTEQDGFLVFITSVKG